MKVWHTKKLFIGFIILAFSINISCQPEYGYVELPKYDFPEPSATPKPSVSPKEEEETKTTTKPKTEPKKTPETPKNTLDTIFLTSEVKHKLEKYVKEDLKSTFDNNGYYLYYKNKDEEGLMINKKGSNSAYWVHADIYKSFKQAGGIEILGYPVAEQEFIHQDKLKDTVAKQLFEKGVIYYFNDPDLENFYENTLVRLYDDLKIDNIDFKFKTDANLPTYAEKSTGRQGDPINIIFIAKNQEQIEKAFDDSKWVKPKFGFNNIPFSELQVYGRGQDLGYARETSNIFTFYKRRHHIRFWNSATKENDKEMWVAAATEDVEVKFKNKDLRQEEKNNKDPDRKNPLTHKIDPDTDKEREYVRKTLTEKNPKIKTYFVKHPKISDKFVDTTNSSLDLVLWDGRILVVDLSDI
ncbi:MAG: LssY C-terminal domain-containing protein [Candidatus Sericytochromatia bacterium]